MSSQSRISSLDQLSPEVEHCWHEYLRIGEVVLLERISEAWRLRIRRALRMVPWDAVHRERDHDDLQEYNWLAALQERDVKIRTLRLPKPREALANASIIGSLDVMKILVEHFPQQVNDAIRLPRLNMYVGCRQSPLHRSIKHHKHDIVRFLLSLDNIDVHVKDHCGQSAIHHAAIDGPDSFDVMKLLMTSHDVDLNVADNSGSTPLHKAVLTGHLDGVKFLASLDGIDVNVVNNSDETPLMWAAEGRTRSIEIVRFLTSLESVDVNATDRRGATALHHAVEWGRLEFVRCLASLQRVDINVADEDGRTPMRIAVRKRHRDIVDVLKRRERADGNVVEESTLSIPKDLFDMFFAQ